MKIMGIGLNKTGTKSLGSCLMYWGMKHISCNETAFDLWRKKNLRCLMEIASVYDSCEDWPWPLMYRELDHFFPKGKFILTVRLNADVWYKSLCQHALVTGPTEYRKYVYGAYMPQGHKQRCIEVYERHNHMVRKYFKDRPGDFLEICWEKGDGWEELSCFLSLPQPDFPFPHTNKGRCPEAYD